MDSRNLTVAAVCAVVLAGCGVEVSLRGLQFESHDSQGTDTGTTVEEGLSCSRLYHCILEDGGDGTEEECVDRMEAGADKTNAQKLLSCREEGCGGYQSKPDELVKCLLAKCTDPVMACMATDGQDSCHAYALNWWMLLEEQSSCDTEPSALCHFEFLERLSPADVTVVSDGLFNCFEMVLAHWQIWKLDPGNEQKKDAYWKQFWSKCLPVCE